MQAARPAVLPRHNNLELDGAGDQQPPAASTSQKYGPGDYKPVVGITYWSFRLMIGLRRRCRRCSRCWLPGWRASAKLRRQPSLRPARRLRDRRCRCSPTARAGCSPRWAASRGWCSACSRPPTASRPSVRVRHGAGLADRLHRCSTPCSPSSRSGCSCGRPRASSPRPRPSEGTGAGGDESAAARRRRVPRAGPRLLTVTVRARHRHEPAGLLVSADRGAVDRLLHPRGVRLRGRHAAAGARPRRHRPPGRSSTPSGRSGTATRCGCSSPAARPSPPSRSGTRRCSAASTCRCC